MLGEGNGAEDCVDNDDADAVLAIDDKRMTSMLVIMRAN